MGREDFILRSEHNSVLAGIYSRHDAECEIRGWKGFATGMACGVISTLFMIVAAILAMQP